MTNASSDNISSTFNPHEPFSTGSVSWCILVSIYTIITITTISGNFIVILTYYKCDFIRRCISNIYILSLSFADLTVGLLVMTLDLSSFINGAWVFGSFVCTVWLSVQYMAVYVSVVNILVISVDRFRLLSNVLRYKRSQTMLKSRVIVLIVWIYSLAFSITYLSSSPTLLNPLTYRNTSVVCSQVSYEPGSSFSQLQTILECLDFFVPFLLLNIAMIGSVVAARRSLNNPVIRKVSISRNKFEMKRYLKEKERAMKRTLKVKKEQCSVVTISGTFPSTACLRSGQKGIDSIEINDISKINEDKHTNLNYSEGISTGQDKSCIKFLKFRKFQYDVNKDGFDPSQLHSNEISKVMKGLAILVLSYIACWLPFHIIFVTETVSEVVFSPIWSEYLLRIIWFNSTVNPFLYAITNNRFRLGMVYVLCFWKRGELRKEISMIRTFGFS